MNIKRKVDNEVLTKYAPKLFGRNQLDYNYNGQLDKYGDEADCYKPSVKVVRIG